MTNALPKDTTEDLLETISILEDALREVLSCNRLADAKETAAYVLDVDLNEHTIDDEEEDYQYDIDSIDELDMGVGFING